MGLKLVMCLQISADSPSNCFGTIRYILSGQTLYKTLSPMFGAYYRMCVQYLYKELLD